MIVLIGITLLALFIQYVFVALAVFLDDDATWKGLLKISIPFYWIYFIGIVLIDRIKCINRNSRRHYE